MCFRLFCTRASSSFKRSRDHPLLNSKLKALIQEGHYVAALQVYTTESPFHYTSKFTFPSLLKACSCLQNLYYGKAIHSTIINLGLQFDPYIATSLVNMYIKCGELNVAVKVFESMSQTDALAQDVTLWNSMADGLIKYGLFEKAIAHFYQMRSVGVRPDRYSLSILLGVFGRRFDLQSAKEIHGYIVRNSFNDDPFVVTALIDMYCSGQRPMDAWGIFDGLVDKNYTTAVWNAMICGFCENGCWRKSLELYSSMKNEAYKLESSTFSSVLVACSLVEDVDIGKQVHCDVIKAGFEDEPYASTSLLTMYAKFGFVEDAEKVFDSAADDKVEIWNSMISAYVGNNRAHDALDICYRMRLRAVPSDSFTLSETLLSCSMIGSLDIGRKIHAEIVKKPLQDNISVQGSLLSMYSKCGKLTEALKVFWSMEVKDVVSWGSILSGCLQNGEMKEAFYLFRAMESNGMQPDPDILVNMINVSAAMDNMDLGCSIHGIAIKRGLESNPFISTSLMSIYSKDGLISSVEKVFSDVINKNLVVWNCLISCYCQNGLMDHSISLLPQMMQLGLYPDSVSITTVVLAISSEAALHKGKAVHGYQVRLQIPFDIQLENALINMYVKCGSLTYAQHLFSKMSTRNLVSWNSMIVGYGSHGECLKALNLFNEMKTSNISPDNVSFLSLISSCNYAGLIREGLHFFELMKEYRIDPRMEDYINIVDLLGRAGHLDDAYKFIQNMPVEPEEGIWLCLLSACRLHQNVELGELAAENLIKMNPNRGSNYKQLLNLYAEAGLEEKAAKLATGSRSFRCFCRRGVIDTAQKCMLSLPDLERAAPMRPHPQKPGKAGLEKPRIRTHKELWATVKEMGLKKAPGFSWIEVKNKVDVFFSGDSSSAKTIEIHETLQNLRSHIKRIADHLLDLEDI